MSNDLVARAALEWIAEHTTIQVDPTEPEALASLPARAQLFVQKYSEVMNRKAGVTSSSIEGLSLSFDSTDSSALVWQLAYSLLAGDLKSQATFIPAKRRW